MTELEEKFKKIINTISQEKGNIKFFAIARRSDSEGFFDILISADWIRQDDFEILKYIVKIIKSLLNKEEIIDISRVILLNSDDPILKQLRPAITVELGGIVHLDNCVVNNLAIEELTIFVS
ncbi:hypothetical protein [uncultured Methanospirillum sp.]|uniref:hypothetical protein n=1 Tax=uncultured Methanospirillum sp. TaxID=262503 RepID=UPI0029C78285|nr:hypothetical protein [uncultured Methanospirillum sp.]